MTHSWLKAAVMKHLAKVCEAAYEAALAEREHAEMYQDLGEVGA